MNGTDGIPGMRGPPGKDVRMSQIVYWEYADMHAWLSYTFTCMCIVIPLNIPGFANELIKSGVMGCVQDY